MYIYQSPMKIKLIKVSFVTIKIKLQQYTCILIMKTQYGAYESAGFEVQESMKTSYETMKEQTIIV